MNQTLNIHDIKKIEIHSVRKLNITADKEVFSKTLYFLDANGNELEIIAFSESAKCLNIINKIKFTR